MSWAASYGLPIVAPLEEEGHFVEGFGWLTGKHVSEVPQPIFDDLERRGLLYRVQNYHPPLPDLLALQDTAGVPSGGRVVHQHGE